MKVKKHKHTKAYPMRSTPEKRALAELKAQQIPFEDGGVWQNPAVIDDGHVWRRFRVGTCEGLWGEDAQAFRILAVINHDQGNGHFAQAIRWFMNSCRRYKRMLIVHEVVSDDLARKLLNNGFVPMVGTPNFMWTP